MLTNEIQVSELRGILHIDNDNLAQSDTKSMLNESFDYSSEDIEVGDDISFNSKIQTKLDFNGLHTGGK